MLPTSDLYKRLLAGEHSIETRLVIGTSGVLIDEGGDRLTFGEDSAGQTVRILVEQGGADDGHTESEIFEMSTYHALFDGNMPTIGCTVAGRLDVSFIDLGVNIPKMSEIILYIRLTNLNRTEHSEWIKKGVYYIDTREVSHNDNNLDIIKITAYDALIKTQADYPDDTTNSYPALDTAIVNVIAKEMDVEVDSRTWEIMTGGYRYALPINYSMNEMLSYIAMSYAGNWVMTDEGRLRLISYKEIPKETRLLTDEIGYTLVFGEEVGTDEPIRIVV